MKLKKKTESEKPAAHGHEPVSGDKGTGKKAAKSVPKAMIWIPVGLAVILLEVGVSYTLVNRFTAPKTKGEVKAAEVIPPKEEGKAEKEEPNQENKEEPAEKKKTEKPSSETVDGSVAGEQEIKIGSSYSLEDLVVNPAFSNGKHYFILSVVLTFDNAPKIEMIRECEPILRDRLLTLLSAKTFYWLCTHTNREILREEVGGVVGEILKIKSGYKVYFTKYVLQ